PTSQGSWLIRLACSAVLVGAHYREPRRDDKGNFAKNGIFWFPTVQTPIYPTKSPATAGAQAI
ncbi:hypothetical protein ACK33C_22050, partial [Aeromonas hydrophila]|uniref:hypothetical protein n=1 Tax=Aeromonas hydrophila TaxID=644 RepID=UPI0039889EF7